ncbi:MAG: protoheme IX farnesyltransferase [Bacteroidetes bacterium]|nr:protoheme IX farnesyltransferase [Bacteroidota bacterium]
MLKSIALNKTSGFATKLKDYLLLVKLRLTISVVVSAVLGYLIAIGSGFEINAIIALSIGGLLVVGSANGINQIIEKDFDSKMIRTNNRPLATNRMTVFEAALFCIITGVAGVYILGTFLNQLSAILGFISLISYGFFYTPLKRFSSIAVYIGAIPGAIPPMLGWVAATGKLEIGAAILFAIQFLWQFPHFWAIAWLLDEDYKRAGYNLLPSKSGKSKLSAFIVFIFTLALIPLSALPYFIGIAGIGSLIPILILGILISFFAFKLYKTLEKNDAKKLMFFSILYNTAVLLILFIDKL